MDAELNDDGKRSFDGLRLSDGTTWGDVARLSDGSPWNNDANLIDETHVVLSDDADSADDGTRWHDDVFDGSSHPSFMSFETVSTGLRYNNSAGVKPQSKASKRRRRKANSKRKRKTTEPSISTDLEHNAYLSAITNFTMDTSLNHSTKLEEVQPTLIPDPSPKPSIYPHHPYDVYDRSTNTLFYYVYASSNDYHVHNQSLNTSVTQSNNMSDVARDCDVTPWNEGARGNDNPNLTDGTHMLSDDAYLADDGTRWHDDVFDESSHPSFMPFETVSTGVRYNNSAGVNPPSKASKRNRRRKANLKRKTTNPSSNQDQPKYCKTSNKNNNAYGDITSSRFNRNTEEDGCVYIDIAEDDVIMTSPDVDNMLLPGEGHITKVFKPPPRDICSNQGKPSEAATTSTNKDDPADVCFFYRETTSNEPTVHECLSYDLSTTSFSRSGCFESRTSKYQVGIGKTSGRAENAKSIDMMMYAGECGEGIVNISRSPTPQTKTHQLSLSSHNSAHHQFLTNQPLAKVVRGAKKPVDDVYQTKPSQNTPSLFHKETSKPHGQHDVTDHVLHRRRGNHTSQITLEDDTTTDVTTDHVQMSVFDDDGICIFSEDENVTYVLKGALKEPHPIHDVQWPFRDQHGTWNFSADEYITDVTMNISQNQSTPLGESKPTFNQGPYHNTNPNPSPHNSNDDYANMSRHIIRNCDMVIAEVKRMKHALGLNARRKFWEMKNTTLQQMHKIKAEEMKNLMKHQRRAEYSLDLLTESELLDSSANEKKLNCNETKHSNNAAPSDTNQIVQTQNGQHPLDYNTGGQCNDLDTPTIGANIPTSVGKKPRISAKIPTIRAKKTGIRAIIPTNGSKILPYYSYGSKTPAYGAEWYEDEFYVHSHPSYINFAT